MEVSHKPVPDELLRECEDLCYRLAPEVERVYCLNLPDDHPQWRGECAAFTFPGRTNLFVRQALIDQGRWQGVGAQLVYVPEHQTDRDETLASTLHELGHNVPYVTPPAYDTDPDHLLARMTLQRELIESSEPPTEAIARPHWIWHELPFIRAALHLHWRAWQLGYEVGLGQMRICGPRYDTSPHWSYFHALGNEPRRMAGETFATIMAETAPTEFAALWRADVAAWCRNHPESKESNYVRSA